MNSSEYRIENRRYTPLLSYSLLVVCSGGSREHHETNKYTEESAFKWAIDLVHSGTNIDSAFVLCENSKEWRIK